MVGNLLNLKKEKKKAVHIWPLWNFLIFCQLGCWFVSLFWTFDDLAASFQELNCIVIGEIWLHFVREKVTIYTVARFLPCNFLYECLE